MKDGQMWLQKYFGAKTVCVVSKSHDINLHAMSHNTVMDRFATALKERAFFDVSTHQVPGN